MILEVSGHTDYNRLYFIFLVKEGGGLFCCQLYSVRHHINHEQSPDFTEIFFRFYSYQRSCSGMAVSESHISVDGSESTC